MEKQRDAVYAYIEQEAQLMFFLNSSYHQKAYQEAQLPLRGVDPYGSGGTRPPNIWTGGHYHECPPQYF